MKPDTIAEYIIYALGIIAILLAVLMLQGCARTMTNDEVIAETKKCEDAGMRAIIYINAFQDIVGVKCWPKKETR